MNPNINREELLISKIYAYFLLSLYEPVYETYNIYNIIYLLLCQPYSALSFFNWNIVDV